MVAPGPFIWWLGRGVEAFRLAPILAAAVNRRSGRFVREPWMVRLEVYLVWDTLIAGTLLGMAMAGIRNLWLSDLTFFFGFLLAAWTLSGLRQDRRVSWFLMLGAVPVLGAVAWEAFHFGLSTKWVLAMALASTVILLASLWELTQLMLKDEETPLHQKPPFWLLSIWVLQHGMMLIFYPLSKYFLRTLSREWILYPWLVIFLLDGVFNLILAKTFLCLKPRSS